MSVRSDAGCIYPLSLIRLLQDNRRYQGTKAVSEGNCSDGCRPAFLDSDTNIVYPSCRADGRLAAVHCLEGLPDELVVSRDAAGRVMEAKPGLIAGFLYGGRFYSREEALRLLQEP
ncbi:MAG: hypothetical protein J5I81_10610 [Nitrococcus mobilis]|nr:hypothetical protein [Nitrococcus mobilis]